MGVSTNGYIIYGIMFEEDDFFEYEESLEGEYLEDEFYENKNYPDITLQNYCSDSSEMYILGVKHLMCRRGYPSDFNPTDMEIKPEWKKQIQDACKKLGKKYLEPKWYLCSYWG